MKALQWKWYLSKNWGQTVIRIWTYRENYRFYGFIEQRMKDSGDCLSKVIDAQKRMACVPDIFHLFQIQSLSLSALLYALGRWFLHIYSLRLPCFLVSSCIWPMGGTSKRANCEKTECRISSSCFFLLGQGLTTQLLYLSPQLLTGSPFPTATTPSKFSTHTFITCPFTKLSSVTLPSASFFPAVYRLIEHTQGTEHGQVCPLE